MRFAGFLGRLPFPLQVAGFCLLWASAFSVAKVALTDCPPLLLLTIRFLIAGVVVLGVAALLRMPFNLGRRDILVFAALGVINQAAYLGISYVGMQTISSGLTALIISTNPVLVAVLAAFVLGERMTARKAIGLLLGVAGVAIVVQGRLAGGHDDPFGIVLTLIALCALVAGTILFKWLAPQGGFWIGNGVQSLAAGLATLPFALGFETVSDIVVTWHLVAALAYLVLLVSVFAYVLWFHMLSVSGATAASAWHFVMPPLGMLFGWLLLGERVALTDLIGVVPVAIGILLVTRAPREKTPTCSRAQAAGSARP